VPRSNYASLKKTPAAQTNPLDSEFDRIFLLRQKEADEFYAKVMPPSLSEDGPQRPASGLCRTPVVQTVYHYAQRDWLAGDPAQPTPPEQRKHGRNSDWSHVYNADVISMPDKWEYPWYAAWDLAFSLRAAGAGGSGFR